MNFSRSLIYFFLFNFIGLVQAIDGNAEGSPQDISGTICENRPRETCQVELDVPTSCAGIDSTCPIVIILHGSGGTNEWFKRTSGVHSAGYIGV